MRDEPQRTAKTAYERAARLSTRDTSVDPYTALRDEAALATALDTRRDRDCATIATEDMATLRDVLVHAAEARCPVTMATTQAEHRGTIASVGPDSVLFRGSGGREALITIAAITAVTAPWRRTPLSTSRAPGRSFSTALAELAVLRPAVRVVRIGRLDPLVGVLRTANESLCCLEQAPGAPPSRTYLDLCMIAEVWIEP